MIFFQAETGYSQTLLDFVATIKVLASLRNSGERFEAEVFS